MNKLEKENEVLRHIVENTLWMARRYADGRMSYAPSMFNQAVTKLIEIGQGDLFKGDPAEGGKRYADDGMLGKYDPEQGTFVK